MDNAKFLLTTFILLSLGVFASIIFVFVKLKPKATRFETTICQAKVVRKNYEPDCMSNECAFIGSMYLPVKKYHFERYNVFLIYDGCEFCIDDKNLFATANFGDYVEIKLTKGFDKKNHLISNKIELLTE